MQKVALWKLAIGWLSLWFLKKTIRKSNTACDKKKLNSRILEFVLYALEFCHGIYESKLFMRGIFVLKVESIRNIRWVGQMAVVVY
jgi:hypothetical protein